MFAAFTLFGMLPVVAFVVADTIVPDAQNGDLFTVACAVTGMSLFGLGALKARFADKRYFHSGLETTLLGGACAAVAYFVGAAVANAVSGSSMLFLTARAEHDLQ